MPDLRRLERGEEWSQSIWKERAAELEATCWRPAVTARAMVKSFYAAGASSPGDATGLPVSPPRRMRGVQELAVYFAATADGARHCGRISWGDLANRAADVWRMADAGVKIGVLKISAERRRYGLIYVAGFEESIRERTVRRVVLRGYA